MSNTPSKPNGPSNGLGNGDTGVNPIVIPDVNSQTTGQWGQNPNATSPVQAPNFADWVGTQGPQAVQFGQVSTASPNYAPQYGGGYGDANATAQELEIQGQDFQNRYTPNLSYMQYGDASGSIANAQTAQRAATAMLGSEAAGGGASPATIGMGSQIAGNLASAYAAGRTGGALGMQAAQAADAGANAGAASQGGAGAASERLSAQNAYAGALGSQRGANIQNEQLAQQAGINQAQLTQGFQNEDTQAQLQAQGQANNVLLSQLQSDSTYENAVLGNAAQLGAQQIGINAAQTGNLVSGGAGALSGALGAVGSYASQGGQAQPSYGYDGDFNSDVTYSDARLKKEINFADAVMGAR